MKLQDYIDMKDAAERRFLAKADAAYQRCADEIADNLRTYAADVAASRNRAAYESFKASIDAARAEARDDVAAAFDGMAGYVESVYSEAPDDASMRRISAFQMRENPADGEVKACALACGGNVAALLTLHDVASAKNPACAALVPDVPDMEELSGVIGRFKGKRLDAIARYLNVSESEFEGARGIESVLSGGGGFTPGSGNILFDRLAAELAALGK